LERVTANERETSNDRETAREREKERKRDSVLDDIKKKARGKGTQV
jgi:hypothetical protein